MIADKKIRAATAASPTSDVGVYDRRRGFTLIELLVVIAIIAIIAAILLPVLQSAKLRAQQIQSLNNVRQMSIASKLYYDELQKWVGPISGNPISSEGDWMGALLSYYGHASNVLICPSAPDTGNPNNLTNPFGKADSAWHWTIDSYFGASYAKNDWLVPTPTNGLGNATTYPQYIYQNESTVKFPSTTPIFMDSVWINLDPLETDPPNANLYNPADVTSSSPGSLGEGMQRCCIARHGGRPAGAAPRNVVPTGSGWTLPGAISMGFVDTHVESAKLQNLWNYTWHLNWKTPSPNPPL